MSESRISEQEYHLSRYTFKLFIFKPGNGGGGRGLKMNGFFMLFLEDSSPSPTTVRKPGILISLLSKLNQIMYHFWQHFLAIVVSKMKAFGLANIPGAKCPNEILVGSLSLEEIC